MRTMASRKSVAGALLMAVLAGGEANAQAASKGQPQAQDSVATRISQAQLAEQSERDFARAAELWRAIAEDTTVDAEKRGQAWIAAARNLQRLGKAEEAKKALDAADALGGKAGEEAKRIREGGTHDPRLAERAGIAVGALQNLLEVQQGEVDVTKPPFSDVVWLGDAAVPALAWWIEQPTSRSSVVSGCVKALVQIGGDEATAVVARLVSSPDVLLRRALLEGLGDGKGREPVRSTLMKLIDDPDRRVRFFALDKLMSVMTREELLAQATRPDGMLPDQAIRRARKLEESAAGFQVRGYSEELVAVLRGALDSPSLDMRKSAADALQERVLFSTAAGRELYLAALASDAMHEEGIGQTGWQMRVELATAERFSPTPSAQRLVDVARAALDTGRRSASSRELATRGLSSFMQLSVRSVQPAARPSDRAVDPWPDDHATLLEIGRIGGWNVIRDWAMGCARIEELPALLTIALEHERAALGAASLIAPRARELPAEQQRACIATLVRGVERARGAKDDGAFVQTLIALGLPDADRAVVAATRAEPELYERYVSWLLERKEPEADLEALADLLVLPARRVADGQVQGAVPSGSSWRAQIFRLLAESQARELPERLAEAYRAGLPDGGNENVLRYLFVDSTLPVPSRGWWSWAPRYSVEVLSKALRECAEADVPMFWSHLSNLIVMQLDSSYPADPSRDEVSRVVAEFLPRIAQATMEERTREQIAKAFVGGRCAGWEEFAVAAFDDRAVSQAILEGLKSMPKALLPKVLAQAEELDANGLARVPWYVARSDDPATREQLLTLLRHPSATLRWATVDAIAEHAPARLVESVEPLVKDRSYRVRSAVARALRTSFDRAAIPQLIELLRDPEESVQKSARESLDQLQYYFDSKLRWERLLSESGIDANNAAEALLKQARSGASVEVRKAAIDSLGTLKVPEALPFLIELMADPDPAIAAAARAAITKING